jgi:hypothetical protein
LESRKADEDFVVLRQARAKAKELGASLGALFFSDLRGYIHAIGVCDGFDHLHIFEEESCREQVSE